MSARIWVALAGLCWACGGPARPADTPTTIPEVAAESSEADAARARLEKERAARPRMNDAARAAYEAGVRAFDAGDLNGAVSQFTQAIQQDGRAYQAHFALGAVYDRQGHREQAEQCYRAALSIVPGFEPAIRELAAGYFRSGQLAVGESFLNAQRSQTPDSAAVLAALAELKSLQRDSEQAQELARQALKKDPDHRPAMVVMARDHYRNRRLDLALYTLTAILDGYGPENPPRDKNNPEARLIRALILREQGNRARAIEELRLALSQRPDIVEARIHLAAFLLEAGNSDEAVPLLEGALAYEPANPLIHLNLGDAYRLQGRPREALTQLEWVTQAAPDLAEAHYDIGLVYLFSENIDGVSEEQAVDKAIVAFDTYLRMQGSARAASGDDAEELLKRAKNKKAILDAMKGRNAAAPQDPPAPEAEE